MKELLMDLTKIKGVLGALVVAKDGMIITSDIAIGVEEEVIGAMFSSIGNVIERSASLLHMGNFMQAIIDSHGGKVFISDADFAFIGLVTIPEVNIGFVRLELKRVTEQAMIKMHKEEEKPQKSIVEDEDEERLV